MYQISSGRISMRRFKAFTLTELMVALAVIGVLVAVVTPAIMRTRPNKNKMMIKKSYYEAEKIVSSLINDEILYSDGRDACNSQDADTETGECRWGFDDFRAVRYDGEIYGAGELGADATEENATANKKQKSEKFAGLFAAKLNWKAKTNYVYTTADGVTWDLTGTTISDNKVVWSHDKTLKPYKIADETNYIKPGSILIDVNGSEGPNCREKNADGTKNTDFDRYQIDIWVNGKMNINKNDEKAAEFITINTSLRDSL